MNREDIIKLAKQVEADGFAPVGIWPEVRRLCELVYAAGEAAEREACAKVCESMRPSEREFDQRFYTACTLNANAIRARNQA